MTILGTINMTRKPPDGNSPTHTPPQNAHATQSGITVNKTTTTTATPAIHKNIGTEKQTVQSIVLPTDSSDPNRNGHSFTTTTLASSGSHPNGSGNDSPNIAQPTDGYDRNASSDDSTTSRVDRKDTTVKAKVEGNVWGIT